MKKLSKRDEKMVKAGWAPVSLVAEKLGVHHATIYRMIDNVELECRTLMGKKYVSIKSVIGFLGEDNARILGLVDETASPSRSGADSVPPIAAEG